MVEDSAAPPLWQQHHVLWAAFGISIAVVILFITLGIFTAFAVHERVARDHRKKTAVFEYKLARSIAACIPAAGILGVFMSALILRRILYTAGLVIVTAVGSFALMGIFAIPVAPFVVWAGLRLRRLCWEGNPYATLVTAILYTFFAFVVFALVIAKSPSSLHDKIPLIAALSLLVSDALIVSLIGILNRTSRLAPIIPGFRISLSTFMAVILSLAAYVTLLVNVFQ